MNTPAHLIFGAAAFARPDRTGTLAAALAAAEMASTGIWRFVL